jgi:hypothetical protein
VICRTSRGLRHRTSSDTNRFFGDTKYTNNWNGVFGNSVTVKFVQTALITGNRWHQINIDSIIGTNSS